MSEETLDNYFEFPAQITCRTQSELRALALERSTFDQAALDKYNPFFFSAEISNGRFDSHSTRMAQSSLKNYATEAQSGVSFLYSHDVRELMGRSMGGQFIGAQGNGVARVTSDFFITPGLRLGEVESDQMILAIDSGTLTDVSIGFFGGQWICSICGNDIWDWYGECRHYPGYKAEVQADGKTERVLCTADVEDAHLAETSGVYKGSTPGAMIEKANRQAREGSLDPGTRRFLEQRLHIHLPEKRVIVPGHTAEETSEMSEAARENGSNPTTTDSSAEQAQRGTTTAATTTDAAQEAGEVNVETLTRALTSGQSGADFEKFLRALAKEAGLVEDLDLGALVRSLQARARDGATYRSDMIEEAHKAGVRLYGAVNYNRDLHDKTLRAAELDYIKLVTDDWNREAAVKFKGGRLTNDVNEERDSKPKSSIPDSAYKA